MTNLTQNVSATSLHTSDHAKKRLAKRYRLDKNFRIIGLAAVLAAIGFLVLLLSNVIFQAIPSLTYHYLKLPLDLRAKNINAEDPQTVNQLDRILKNALHDQFPFVKGRALRRNLDALLSPGAGVILRRDILDNPDFLNNEQLYSAVLDDYADLYLKGQITNSHEISPVGVATPVAIDGRIQIFSTSNDFSGKLVRLKEHLIEIARDLGRQADGKQRLLRRIEMDLAQVQNRINSAQGEDREVLLSKQEQLQRDQSIVQAQIIQLQQKIGDLNARSKSAGSTEVLDRTAPSYLININGGVVRVISVSNASIEGEVIIPLNSMEAANAEEWKIIEIEVPEALRDITDRQIVYLEQLQQAGLIEQNFNSIMFSAGASRNPEMAGFWGAIVGSFFTMIITLACAFPLGVASAIYLEEFAPKNRFTHFIEVNINNLAAVPSIIFGLLGLAVFINFFGAPKSTPVVGGLVLALMTLPTIIIASRAALKAVPPSIREAALGVGASKLQTVFHHVLPLAMPGILTGTIIGMAQALGETAPLLMVGMIAFVVDIPGSFLEPATVLPVQIFMWADFPEPAFQQKTSAAITILLLFLVIMNAGAVFLRKRFERRW